MVHHTVSRVQGRHSRPNGIFCLEGDWWGLFKRPASIRPVLELLSQWDPYHVPYIHRNVATRAEFDHYLTKWKQSAAVRYPILNLSFHGETGAL